MLSEEIGVVGASRHTYFLFPGKRGELSIAIANYSPCVQCNIFKRKKFLPAGCGLTLQRMPVSGLQQKFGAHAEEFVDVLLPVIFSDRQYTTPSHLFLSLVFLPSTIPRLLTCLIANSACLIEVSMTGPSAIANWYSIWASAVSISAMCVRIDEEGLSVQECMTPLPRAYVVVYRTDVTPQLVMPKLRSESRIKILWISLKPWHNSKVGFR